MYYVLSLAWPLELIQPLPLLAMMLWHDKLELEKCTMY